MGCMPRLVPRYYPKKIKYYSEYESPRNGGYGQSRRNGGYGQSGVGYRRAKYSDSYRLGLTFTQCEGDQYYNIGEGAGYGGGYGNGGRRYGNGGGRGMRMSGGSRGGYSQGYSQRPRYH